MAKIKVIKARQILDSRGNPTVEADVLLVDGAMGRVSVPSGKSKGHHEACELRDGDPKAYAGMGVLKAVQNIHEVIAPALLGKDAKEQRTLDELLISLDGTDDKSKLGANAILAVSLALAKAESVSQKTETYLYLSHLSPREGKLVMPTAMFNIVNGGMHAQSGSDFQEYMIMPKNSENFARRLQTASEIFHTLGQILEKHNLPTSVGDEGGYAPPLTSNTHALDLILEAIQQAGYKPGAVVDLAIDFAANEFLKDGHYQLKKDKKYLTPDEMVGYVQKLTKDYPLASVEDPFHEDAFETFGKLNQLIGSKVQIVGDDLYTTNPKRLQRGIDLKSTNAILIKPNQIGTLSETIDTIKLAYDNNLNVVISHRSGDTAETFIADLAVAMRAPFVKFGSITRSERLAKYDRLLEIEEQLK